MSRIFISGSSTGLGLMVGELLIDRGHRVVLHARNAGRADDAQRGSNSLDPAGFLHLHPLAANPQANDAALQDRLIAICAELSGVPFPACAADYCAMRA